MSDHSWDFVEHKRILVSQCPMIRLLFAALESGKNL